MIYYFDLEMSGPINKAHRDETLQSAISPVYPRKENLRNTSKTKGILK